MSFFKKERKQNDNEKKQSHPEEVERETFDV